MLLIDKNRAGVQVAVDKRLCIVHKIKLEFGSLQVQFLILIQFLLYKFRIGREHIVSVVVINVWLTVHQIFGYFAEIRIDKCFYVFFLFLMSHDHVGGKQQGIYHKCGYMLCKQRENLMVD